MTVVALVHEVADTCAKMTLVIATVGDEEVVLGQSPVLKRCESDMTVMHTQTGSRLRLVYLSPISLHLSLSLFTPVSLSLRQAE